MQGNLDFLRTIPSTSYNPVQKTDIGQSQTTSGLLVILLPIVVVCAIVGHCKHKAMVLQRQIQWLNRIWQLNSSKNLP